MLSVRNEIPKCKGFSVLQYVIAVVVLHKLLVVIWLFVWHASTCIEYTITVILDKIDQIASV